ncbi:MAG: Mevalonate kinase [Alyxoria varia]|nr:MAG: Mevalonate kinase [Alyxoria varia]
MTPPSSNPYPFAVSAPGKVIVFGEHAVVHGKLAIASAISLRSYLRVDALQEKEHGRIDLSFPDVGLQHTWHTDDLPWASFAGRDRRAPKAALETDLLDAIDPHVQAVSPHLPADDTRRSLHQQAASSFLYMLMHLSTLSTRPCRYTLRSTIPIASGLGSSASISVCIAATLLLQCGSILDPSSATATATTDLPSAAATLDLINRWAFVGELCIHGNPSGIDNTVATRGRAVVFRKRPDHPGGNLIKPISFPEVPSLLVDTKQPRSTAREVAKVAALKTRLPSVAMPILDAIGAVAEAYDAAVEERIRRGEKADPKEISMMLGELVRINHELLAALGVSHPRIEEVRQIVDGKGVGSTKLTGGGGGGCTFTILRAEVEQDDLKRVEKSLGEAGFAKYETVLGAQGVGYLDLSRESPLADIATEKTFLEAEGGEALERLIGVSGDTAKESWRFW